MFLLEFLEMMAESIDWTCSHLSSFLNRRSISGLSNFPVYVVGVRKGSTGCVGTASCASAFLIRRIIEGAVGGLVRKCCSRFLITMQL